MARFVAVFFVLSIMVLAQVSTGKCDLLYWKEVKCFQVIVFVGYGAPASEPGNIVSIV